MTVLMFGGGQDSTAILYKLVLDPAFYARYVRGPLSVVMSDTGDEHAATLHHVEFVKRFCEAHKIPFAHLTSDMGYHPRTWPGLIQWMRRMDGIQAKAYPKSCTDNLKVKPIYNYLEAFVAFTHYGMEVDPRKTKKRYLKRYGLENGPIRVLLGIAREEEGRLGSELPQKWMRAVLERVYPLVEEGLNRHDCQEYIRAVKLPLPPPSNCRRCPFLNSVELVWLYRFDRAAYEEWVELEANKIAKWRRLGQPDAKNYGVNGTRLLPEVMTDALQKYGHWSDEQLQEYKMSHGHCVKSKY